MKEGSECLSLMTGKTVVEDHLLVLELMDSQWSCLPALEPQEMEPVKIRAQVEECGAHSPMERPIGSLWLLKEEVTFLGGCGRR